MRILTIWVAIVAWAVSTFSAQSAPAESPPLAPGKPAGVHQAQASSPDTAIFIGLGLLVIGVGVYMAKGTYKIPGSSSATNTNP